MITQSGVIVTPDNDGAPNMGDIATGLARIARFAGQTKPTIYTVGQHTAACCLFAAAYDGMVVHMLLHDAHEAITSDVPRSWKPDVMRTAQHGLDARIYGSLGVIAPNEKQAAMVKAIDDLILHAEEILIGPPGSAEYSFGTLQPNDTAIEVVKATLEYSEMEVRLRLLDIARDCGIEIIGA